MTIRFRSRRRREDQSETLLASMRPESVMRCQRPIRCCSCPRASGVHLCTCRTYPLRRLNERPENQFENAPRKVYSAAVGNQAVNTASYHVFAWLHPFHLRQYSRRERENAGVCRVDVDEAAVNPRCTAGQQGNADQVVPNCTRPCESLASSGKCETQLRGDVRRAAHGIGACVRIAVRVRPPLASTRRRC